MTQEEENEFITKLDHEWHEAGGFFFDFKAGRFNDDAYERVRGVIAAIDFTGAERISKRLAARIYNIDFFLAENRDHFLENGGSEMLYSMAYTELMLLVGRKFSSGCNPYPTIEEWRALYESASKDFTVAALTPEEESNFIARLESEWGDERGFFFDYKAGIFNERAYKRVCELLGVMNLRGEERISKRLVALIYRIPYFLQQNREQVIKMGGSRILCDKAIEDFYYYLEEKFEDLPFVPRPTKY